MPPPPGKPLLDEREDGCKVTEKSSVVPVTVYVAVLPLSQYET